MVAHSLTLIQSLKVSRCSFQIINKLFSIYIRVCSVELKTEYFSVNASPQPVHFRSVHQPQLMFWEQNKAALIEAAVLVQQQHDADMTAAFLHQELFFCS